MHAQCCRISYRTTKLQSCNGPRSPIVTHDFGIVLPSLVDMFTTYLHKYHVLRPELLLGSYRTKFYILMDTWAQYQLKKILLMVSQQDFGLGVVVVAAEAALESETIFITASTWSQSRYSLNSLRAVIYGLT